MRSWTGEVREIEARTLMRNAGKGKVKGKVGDQRGFERSTGQVDAETDDEAHTKDRQTDMRYRNHRAIE
jgi:hypothetical protein